MDDHLPAFEEVVALIRSPKQPLTCRVIEREGKIEKRHRLLLDVSTARM